MIIVIFSPAKLYLYLSMELWGVAHHQPQKSAYFTMHADVGAECMRRAKFEGRFLKSELPRKTDAKQKN